MDLVQACRAFVAVVDLGSFTRGAERVGTSQSVVSRRVAALERHVGGPLVLRDSARTTPTPRGRHLLPHARALLDRADSLEAAMAAEPAPTAVSVAVPEDLDPRDVAAAHVLARDHGLSLSMASLPPDRRRHAVLAAEVDAGLLASDPPSADHRVALGTGSALARGARTRVEDLRPRRGSDQAPTIWVTAEDVVPHVHGRLATGARRHGLLPHQLQVAASAPEAVSHALTSTDVVVLSQAQARRHDLEWSPLHPPVSRGYALEVSSSCPPQVTAALRVGLAALVAP